MRGSLVPLSVIESTTGVHLIPAPFVSEGEKLAALAPARLWGTAHNATAITAIAEAGCGGAAAAGTNACQAMENHHAAGAFDGSRPDQGDERPPDPAIRAKQSMQARRLQEPRAIARPHGDRHRAVLAQQPQPHLGAGAARRPDPPPQPGQIGTSSSFTDRIRSPLRTPACSAGPLSARPPTTMPRRPTRSRTSQATAAPAGSPAHRWSGPS